MSSIDDLPILPEKTKRGVFTQHLGLVISLVALIVSIVSASQSFRTATLQKELARPLLDAPDALLSQQMVAGKPVFYALITAENTGHLTAFVTDAMVRPEVRVWDDTPEGICMQDLDNVEGKLIGNTEKEIAPGHSQWFSLAFPVPTSCSKCRFGFPINVTFTYHDRVQTGLYRQAIQIRALLH